MTSTNLPDASSIDLSSRLHSRTSVDPGRESEVNASNLPVWGGGKGRLCHRTGGTLRADNRRCGTRTEVVARGINPVLTIYAHPRSDPRRRQEAVRLPGTRKGCGDRAAARGCQCSGNRFLRPDRLDDVARTEPLAGSGSGAKAAHHARLGPRSHLPEGHRGDRHRHRKGSTTMQYYNEVRTHLNCRV